MITIYNPLNTFSVPLASLVQATGLIQMWMDEKSKEESFRELLERQYPFGIYEITGGEVDSEGVYRYPEDPDLFPFVTYKDGHEEFMMYEHAIVAIRDIHTGETFMTRVD